VGRPDLLKTVEIETSTLNQFKMKFGSNEDTGFACKDGHVKINACGRKAGDSVACTDTALGTYYLCAEEISQCRVYEVEE